MVCVFIWSCWPVTARPMWRLPHQHRSHGCMASRSAVAQMDSTGTNPVTDRVNSYRARGALPAHKNWGSAHDRRRYATAEGHTGGGGELHATKVCLTKNWGFPTKKIFQQNFFGEISFGNFFLLEMGANLKPPGSKETIVQTTPAFSPNAKCPETQRTADVYHLAIWNSLALCDILTSAVESTLHVFAVWE